MRLGNSFSELLFLRNSSTRNELLALRRVVPTLREQNSLFATEDEVDGGDKHMLNNGGSHVISHHLTSTAVDDFFPVLFVPLNCLLKPLLKASCRLPVKPLAGQ